MNFPSFVPAEVRVYITTLIEGDTYEPFGLAASLASTEQQLSEIKQAVEVRTRRGEIEYLYSLQRQEAETVKYRDMLSDDVACLRRLGHDGRMQEVYAVLTRHFLHDKQWRGFVHAAWVARVDFNNYRRRIKRATELKEEIAKVAQKLAKLIHLFSETGVDGPGEFYSVPELLRKTDNNEFGRNSQYIWRAMRKHVLGDRQPPNTVSSNQYELALPLSESDRVIKIDGKTLHLPHVRFVSPGDTVEHDPLAGLRYGWEKAPPFSAMVETLADAAHQFTPKEDGFIGAAISSQKRNPIAEYLRAFATLLTTKHKLNVTPPLMKAMAITTNVVIGDQDSDVTYDDVRKVLLKLSGKSLEDFPPK